MLARKGYMRRADIAPTGCFDCLHPGYSCVPYLSPAVGFAHRAHIHIALYLQRVAACSSRHTHRIILDNIIEAVDLPFDDPLTVAIFQRPSNSHEVPTDALDKADQIRQLGLLSVL